MLKQESIQDVRRGKLTKRQGILVAAMCYYPRGLRKELLSEFNSSLAPDRQLLSEWKEVERSEGHDQAFTKTHYEERFQLSLAALLELEHLARLSQKENIFLLCQCQKGERCHREMLMLLAQKKFGAKIGRVFHDYPKFLARFS